MKNLTLKLSLWGLVMLIIISCVSLTDSDGTDTDAAIQATVVAQAVEATLNAQGVPVSSTSESANDAATPAPAKTTQAGETPAPPQTPAPTFPPTAMLSPTPSDFVQYEDFDFQAQGCFRDRNKVICEVIITNRAEDRDVQIGDATEMYDNFNSQYRIDKIDLGNKSIDTPYYNSDITLRIVSQVPTRCRLTFEEVAPDASKITLLRIYIERIEGDWHGVYIELRNIPITQRP